MENSQIRTKVHRRRELVIVPLTVVTGPFVGKKQFRCDLKSINSTHKSKADRVVGVAVLREFDAP